MKTSDVLRGKIVLEATDTGIMCECNVSGNTLGKAMMFDAFCKAMKMYNPLDRISMMAIVAEGGIEGVLKDKADITIVDMSKLKDLM